jgi:hypothetical protein
MQSRRLFSIGDLPSAAPRIVKTNVDRFDIAAYDIDNGYPQRLETLINASPTGKQAVSKLASFLVGQGFDKDGAFWNAVVNSDGETGDELFESISDDYSKFRNFAFHINYNALFQAVEYRAIPLKHVRIGIKEKAGMVAVSTNWWNQDRFGQYVKQNDIVYIDQFNTDISSIKKQVSAAGGWKNYKGQVFLFKREYTLSTVDSVIDAMEAEILAAKTSKSNIKNNFGDKVVWMQPEGDAFAIQEGQEREAYRVQDDYTSGLQEFLGPDAAQLIVAFFKSEADKPDFKTIENKLDDKKFAYTIENARASIYRALDQPAILHSDLTQGRYNQNQLPESMKYYNNITEKDRIKVQRSFIKVFSLFGNYKESDFNITPLNDMTSATQNNEGANSTTVVPNDNPTD